MIDRIASHVKEHIAEYLLPFLAASVWFMFNIYTDIQLMKCKIGMTEGNPRCQIISTIAEDLAKETPEAD